MVCQHLTVICTPNGLDCLSRAAEAVFISSKRPVLGLGRETSLQCLHSDCLFTCSQGAYVCVQCTHVSCRCPAPSKRVAYLPDQDSNQSTRNQQTHLGLHFKSSGHLLFLSVEHAHLYCVSCDDFVFNRFLDAAVAAKARIARANLARFSSSTSPLEAPVQGVISGEQRLMGVIQKRRRLLTVDNWVPSNKELNGISKHSRVFSFPGAELRPPIGLVNLGNSCYMNSVLQAFLNAPPLRNFFLADEHKALCEKRPGAGCLACAIDRMVCDSCFNVKNSDSKGGEGSSPSLKVPFLVPHDILDIMWRNAAHLATYAQHDAHEFLIAALNILNTHCRREKAFDNSEMEHSEPPLLEESDRSKDSNVTRKPSGVKRKVSPVSPLTNVRAEQGGDIVNDAVSSGRSATSIIQSLFSGTLQSDVICRVCGNSSLTLEKFYDISLDVDKFVKTSSTRRSRAPSPAGGNLGSEGQPVSACSTKANVVLSREDRAGPRLKDDNKGLPTPDDPPVVIRASAENVNGNCDGHHERDLDTANSLEECLSRFTEPELLGSSSKMHCTRCGRRQESMKQMSIRTLPPIVCFHFKRFEQSFANIRKSEMIKIDTPVEFPADGMDLSQFQTSTVLRRRGRVKTGGDFMTVHSTLLTTMRTEMQGGIDDIVDEDKFEVRNNTEAVYDLFAVVNHNGRIDSGHYTALIRKKGAWFKCDDEKVTMLPFMEKVIRSEEAYLVFYVQRYPNVQFSDF